MADIVDSVRVDHAGKDKILLFFCIKKVAIVPVSGIITTNLGKTATPIKIAGREKTDTSLQDMPFSQAGEGHFFWGMVFKQYSIYSFIYQIDKILHPGRPGACGNAWLVSFRRIPDSDGFTRLLGAK